MNDKSFTAVLGIIVLEIVHRIAENYSCFEALHITGTNYIIEDIDLYIGA